MALVLHVAGCFQGTHYQCCVHPTLSNIMGVGLLWPVWVYQGGISKYVVTLLDFLWLMTELHTGLKLHQECFSLDMRETIILRRTGEVLEQPA